MVAVIITAIVYGVVALIVKMDDIGLRMVQTGNARAERTGRALVNAMPKVLALLSTVGTVAMLWVGGGIVVHGLEGFGVTAVGHAIHEAAVAAGHAVPAAGTAVEWLVGAAGSGLFGLLLGALLIPLVHTVIEPAWGMVTGK